MNYQQASFIANQLARYEAAGLLDVDVINVEKWDDAWYIYISAETYTTRLESRDQAADWFSREYRG